jgi:metal-responsive CopG/Arc/MetJ family transcriptional regulator
VADEVNRPVPVRLPDSLIARLDDLVDKVGVGNRSDHIRRAIEDYLVRYEQTGVLQPTRTH